MAAPPPETNGIITLFRPIILLSLSAYYIPITIFNLISTLQFNKLTSWSTFQHAWFGTFWSWFGPKSREIGEPVVGPLLTEAHGVVLDIGPGNGQWVNLFSPSRNPNITKIFGVEPNYEHHASLRRRIAEVGLEDVYEILAVGAERLDTCGIEKGSIDTICTIQCLCSVPGPETIIKELYPYLKSGGKWLVFEHVRTKYQNDFVGHWQSMCISGVDFVTRTMLTVLTGWVDHIWPTFFGGCSITRPTDEWLSRAGEWERFELRSGDGVGKYDAIPHVFGKLIKK